MLPAMSSPRLSTGWTVGLLVGLLVVVGLVLAAMGSAVLIPQGSVVFVLGALVLAFLGIQAFLFRSFGLRSAADEGRGAEGSDEASDDDEDDGDWRAWHG